MTVTCAAEIALLRAEALDLLDEIAAGLEAADEGAAGVGLPEAGRRHRSSYSNCLRWRTIGSEAATRAG